MECCSLVVFSAKHFMKSPNKGSSFFAFAKFTICIMRERTLERAVKFEDPLTRGTNRESRLRVKPDK